MDEKRSGKIADSLVSLIGIFKVMKGYSEKSGLRFLPTDPRFSVLSLLSREDLPMSELGRRLMRSKPNMTAIIDGMIGEGMVRRQGDPKDRRIVMISITEKGKKHLQKRRDEIKEGIRKNLSRLDDGELESFAASLETVNRIAEKLGRD